MASMRVISSLPARAVAQLNRSAGTQQERAEDTGADHAGLSV